MYKMAADLNCALEFSVTNIFKDSQQTSGFREKANTCTSVAKERDSVDLLKECLAALNSVPPRTILGVCRDLFEERWPFHYVDPIMDKIHQISDNGLPQNQLLNFAGILNQLIFFVKDVYSRCINSSYTNFQCHELLSPYAMILRQHLSELMENQFLPNLSLCVILHGATLYFLLLQELILIDPSVTDRNQSPWSKTMNVFVKTCITYVLEKFTALWYIRISAVPPPTIPKSEKPQQNPNTITEITKTAVTMRDIHISKVYTSLEEALHYPMATVMSWMRLLVQPLASEERPYLVEAFIRHPISLEETLQSQIKDRETITSDGDMNSIPEPVIFFHAVKNKSVMFTNDAKQVPRESAYVMVMMAKDGEAEADIPMFEMFIAATEQKRVLDAVNIIQMQR